MCDEDREHRGVAPIRHNKRPFVMPICLQPPNHRFNAPQLQRGRIPVRTAGVYHLNRDEHGRQHNMYWREDEEETELLKASLILHILNRNATEQARVGHSYEGLMDRTSMNAVFIKAINEHSIIKNGVPIRKTAMMMACVRPPANLLACT